MMPPSIGQGNPNDRLPFTRDKGTDKPAVNPVRQSAIDKLFAKADGNKNDKLDGAEEGLLKKAIDKDNDGLLTSDETTSYLEGIGLTHEEAVSIRSDLMTALNDVNAVKFPDFPAKPAPQPARPAEPAAEAPRAPQPR